MPQDRVPGGDFDADDQEVVGDLDSPRPAEAQESTAYDVTSIVDAARQLAVDVGVRPYRVFLVHVQWSGKTRGDGQAIVISEIEIVPAPRVRDLSSIRKSVGSTGDSEEGDLVIDRISARYSEDTLLGRTPDLQDPLQLQTSRRNAEFFWEVVEARPTRPNTARRRFSPPRALTLKRPGGWRVTIVRQAGDRSRTGTTGRADF